MKKFFIISIAVIAMAGAAFFVLFLIALQQGPSIDTLTNRVCHSLLVSPSNIQYLGGRNGREPTVFFKLLGKIPEEADIHVLKGWAREDNARMFNYHAKFYHLPCAIAEGDVLLNYKGDIFDLCIANTSNGCFILYTGL